MTREFYYPVLIAFCELAVHLPERQCQAGSYAQIIVSGECGGRLYLYRAEESWQLAEEPIGEKFLKQPFPRSRLAHLYQGIDREICAKPDKSHRRRQAGSARSRNDFHRRVTIAFSLNFQFLAHHTNCSCEKFSAFALHSCQASSSLCGLCLPWR